MGQADELIDWESFDAARARHGAGFLRQMYYAREDGHKAMADIETAMRAHSSAALVLPAERIADEAHDIGLTRVATLATRIEEVARRCVELRHTPEELVPDVVALRSAWAETIDAVDDAINPLVRRKALSAAA